MITPTRRNFILKFLSALLVAPIASIAASEVYTVKKGDTLSGIAQKNRTSVKSLKAVNGLSSDMIRIGQKLTIPGRGKELSSVKSATDKIRLDRKKWKYIVVHHSATPHGNAKSYDRVDRRHGMENGLAYHFVIGNGRDSRDGEIEISSRWTKQLHGGHVSKWEYNNHGIGICLVGNFEKDKPTAKQLRSLQSLITYLGEDLLSGKYKFHVHKEINPTLCPGRNFPTNKMHKLFG